MNAPLVHLEGVRLRHGDRFTLDIPSLTIGPGITVVSGPNGSGKSSLLRLLATVAVPQRGRITVAGRTVVDRDTDRDGGTTSTTEVDAALVTTRRGLGYLPQHDSVPPHLRVFDHVDLVAVMREVGRDTRSRRAMVHRSLVAVGLDDLVGERCRRLSGGQRRRVALAAALTGTPSLLVLDEPDASLDADQLDSLARLLTARAGTATIVVATHHAPWSSALHPVRTIRLVDGVVAPTP